MLLNSNEAPEDSEFTFIRSIVSDADACLARLDDEISKIEGKLQQLKEERALLSGYQACNRSIISPLRRIPPEVLAEIFSCTLPSVTESLRTKEYMACSPWVLSHISARWRAISLSTPSLW
ncbi:hypothetical protein K438DRAFT_1557093, partial [Mycena galopus ATCC 62051]